MIESTEQYIYDAVCQTIYSLWKCIMYMYLFHVCVRPDHNNTLYITGGKHYTEFEHKISNSVYSSL